MDIQLLSLEEATDFLQNVLNINLDEFADRTGLHFLNTIIDRFYEEIPFQNLYVLGYPKVPNFDEIKMHMFNKIGGLCFELNTFLGQLLQVLGYSVSLVCGTENAGEESLHHAFVVAENVETDGDLYCADVGFGYPIFFAVPIHDLKIGDEDSSPGYSLGYWDFKYARETEEMYALKSYDTAQRSPDVVEFVDNIEMPKKPSWTIEFTFSLKPISFAEAVEIMTPVYTLPLESYFQVNLHCVTFRGKLALGYKNKAFLRECPKTHNLKAKRVFVRLSDLQESIMRHFPAFDENVVEGALRNLEINQQNAPHLVAKPKSRKLSICQNGDISSLVAGLQS